MNANFLRMTRVTALTSWAKMRCAVLASLTVLTPAGYSAPLVIQLPADGVQLKPSELPGYEKAKANCVACHSAEYMLYQPSNAARPYWDAMAKRMKLVFNAPIDEADMPVIVDYLVKTYGNEQAR
jgi:hypothetical protein